MGGTWKCNRGYKWDYGQLLYDKHNLSADKQVLPVLLLLSSPGSRMRRNNSTAVEINAEDQSGGGGGGVKSCHFRS